MTSDKLAYLETKPSLDAQVLMSDCGSDVSMGSRKDNLLDSNRCAYPCLSIAVLAAIKNCAIGMFLGRLVFSEFSEGRAGKNSPQLADGAKR